MNLFIKKPLAVVELKQFEIRFLMKCGGVVGSPDAIADVIAGVGREGSSELTPLPPTQFPGIEVDCSVEPGEWFRSTGIDPSRDIGRVLSI